MALFNAFHVIFIIVSLYGTFCLSLSSPIENDGTAAHLTMLTARLDGLQAKTEQLSLQLEEEKTHRINLQALNKELISNNQKQEEKINLLMTQVAQQQEEIRCLKDTSHDGIEPKQNKVIDSPRAPPSSCRQLSTIGHSLDGIYLIANPDSSKIETVYCDFGTTLTEIFYGNVDVKLKSIHFSVQRINAFGLNNAVIPFEVEVLNVGGAMDTASGTFTAPVGGIYHFEFSGMKGSDPTALNIALQVNGVDVGSTYATDLANVFALSGINISLKLQIGDTVRLFKTTGTLNDFTGNNRNSHFSGWLEEEDVVLV